MTSNQGTMASNDEAQIPHIQIRQLKKIQREWTIHVVILRTIESSYENNKGSGKILKLILADSEGKKIQGIMFGETIEMYKHMLQKNHVLYISNGEVKPINPLYGNVHESIELTLTKNISIKESNANLQFDKILNNFISIKEAISNEDTRNINVLAMIANVKPMIKYVTRYNKADTRRDIIIVDKDEITLSVTLFGDLAGNEGSIIERNMHEPTIIALSDFKIALYKGKIFIMEL
ncbi:replication protein A 70 kDa DNA-binding subunit D-like [Asparagus officinalis]|uniref:replication protein A 70 kDa DNA-binding subunit D-like n=1 Tax=Asparagus officinalis TaxID=4686 RepID=UPI00098E6ED6|nr:replication protein A 70 kDa DNA-binding subunit D-like [Asparagus officinalis]